ncbi:MAG: hypothetical protein A2Y61_02230 [Chloroflexi bacterium RBG_13_60_13]|nr:MAG: hypothetical protein A2Y61_02230 [Chloroflexi bacterium RBG_13_60_13]
MGRLASPQGTVSYTRNDAETGFTYLRARHLSPGLGRFLSADSVSPNAPGSQGYNPYAYVANNPTTWVDPSGHYSLAAATTGSFLGGSCVILP